MTDREHSSSHAALIDAVVALDGFLEPRTLTDSVKLAERQLDGADASRAREVVQQVGMTPELLTAALVVRKRLGRINDLVHAVGIALVLPHILEDGEKIVARPSLAAGNDPNRPFDLETSIRVAEFKFSRWLGADAQRRKDTFKDLVALSLNDDDRRPELFVFGTLPVDWLTTGESRVKNLLKNSRVRERLEAAFGDVDMTVSEFTSTLGSHVRIRNVQELLPPQNWDLF